MAANAETKRERTVTAEEAANELAALLEEVRAGATIHVMRDGVEVCVMRPPQPKSYKLSDILKRLEEKPIPRPDDEFAKDLNEVINLKRPPSEPLKWD